MTGIRLPIIGVSIFALGLAFAVMLSSRPMGGNLIAIVRSAARLEILVHATDAAQDPEQPWNVEHACVLRPFLPSSRPGLWAAWNALASVTVWDETLSEHVRSVLQATVPSGADAGDLPALGPEVYPAPAPRATAAHPRAFRGTRWRPPKPPRPQPVDLRPYLLAGRHIDQVLDLLPDRSRIERLPGLEPWFVLHVLPLLQRRPSNEINHFAALARALDLQRDEALRATLVGVLLAADAPARAARWWSHVLAAEPDRRLAVARMMYASGVVARDPVAVPDADPRRRWFFYRGIAAGAAPAYLLAGLRLIAGSPRSWNEEVPAGQDDVEAIVRATIERLANATERDSGPEFWTEHLWRLCGEQPALVRLLELPAFQALVPPAGFWLLRLAASWRWNPESAAREAPILLEGARRIAVRAAAAEPAYQLKLVEDVADMYWWASDDERDLATAIDRALCIAGRVARPPFATEPVIGPVAHRFARLDQQHLDALLAAPDASFAALERACRRENDARLLGRGLEALSARLPALVTTAFAGSPQALLATADTLAALAREAQAQVIAVFQTTSLAADTLASAPLERLAEALAPINPINPINPIVPIRRALRQHLAGDRRLSEAQLRGHHARIVAALDEIRLAALRKEAERVLAARVNVERIESSTVRHVLAMLSEADRNRRQLRRLLIAYFAGDRDWRLRHPETLAWLARHPRLDQAAWLAGIATQGSVDGLGALTLAMETDPLEALKAGTSVGTCLGRGGGFSYSAAAIVLDVNKHVVYARDARGSVIGRQLIAVSESDELVCFHPYGQTETLHPLFRDFDRELSKRFGLPVYSDRDNPEGHYEIASILSQDWWDDLHWETEEGSLST